ncbi:MFS transporter [Effusibacillus lacus]|uniref:MFS transporter n=1 Tax=Effusibacillus lacus TaxID=1348429 RepID=UPI0022B098BE|nr:MFS transporter [Effusibacillus lacus]
MFGYMEASLNVNFPVYAVRNGIALEWVSVILPAFVVGSLALQMPLGKWSDKTGRQKVMTLCAVTGAAAFVAFPFAGDNVWAMMALLALAGATVGSFYSLGLAFVADILPQGMVPTAGIIASMNFSLASILAPNLNGVLLDSAWPGSMFAVMGGMLALFAVSGPFFRRRRSRQITATHGF